MSKQLVPLQKNPRLSVTVETEATIGATVGTNLYWPNGTVVTEAELTQITATNNITIAQLYAQFVPLTRTISTTSPLSGGGALSADLTLAIANQAANVVLAGPVSGGAAAPTFRAVIEADLALTDVTTANASTSAHGFLKKLPNDATKYMDGTGNYSVPAGGGAGSVVPESSGVLTGGVISIGAGGAGVATTFSITAGTGQIVDNTVDPSTVTAVSWSAQTNIAVTNILTQLITYVAIDSGGSVVQSATDWTPVQQREYVVIGIAVHSNQTTVNAVNQAQVVAYAPGAQANDLMYGLGIFNVTGNLFSANGANLKVNKSTGSLFRRGSNYTTLSDNPHIITTASLTQAPLRMQNQTGAGSASGTDIDVANYDVGGVTTAVSPSTRFTVLRVFLFQSNLVAIQRGQTLYLSLAEAKAAIQTQTYVTNSILAANGLLRGFIVAQANATSLNDAAKVFFLEAGRFGGSAGVGGLSVSTLQNAYDNSSDPEIVTDATRLGLTIRRGSGADTDVILEGQTGAAATTFSVTGAGVIGAGTWNATAIGAVYGGTAQTTYATGDILYASAANTLSKLAAGTNGHVLTLAAGIPSWAAGGAGSGDSVSFAVAQVAHGLTIGNTITLSGSTWVKADRDASTTTAIGLVSAVADADNFTVLLSGKMTLTTGQWDAITGDAGGLTAGEYYCLSSTAGGLTKTAPTTGIKQWLLAAVSTTVAAVFLGEPFDLSSAGITALTGDVTASGSGSVAATLATAQPAVHTWALAQTFTVAPVFTNQSGTRTALGLGSLATVSSLTGHVTSTGAATLLGSFTFAQLNTAISDADTSDVLLSTVAAVTIPAEYGRYIPGGLYTITSGTVLTIASGAVLEIG